MRAIAVSCPQCGASLQVAGDVEVMTCQYCGNTAHIQRRSRVLQVPRPLPPTVASDARPIARQRWSWIAVVPLVVMVCAVGLVGFVALRLGRTVERAVRPSGPTAAPGMAKASWAGDAPVVTDLDDDGVDDLIGRVRYVQDGDRTHLAAFSGATGRPLWIGAPLGTYTDLISSTIALRGDLVLLARPDGVLDAFARATGAPRWSVPMGEKVEVMCAGDVADQAVVVTADERWWVIDGAGGKRATASRQRFDRPPHDGHAVERLRAVGAEVGPDVCLRIDNRAWSGPVGLLSLDVFASLPDVPGIDLRRLVRRPGGPLIGVGTKEPGTAVPMLARLDGDRAAWAVEVPASAPLTSRAEDKLVALSERAVFAVYEGASASSARLTGFALADGHRLWDVAMSAEGPTHVDSVIAAGDLVLVATPFALFAFDQADGHLRYQIGAR